jgi:Multicopper oxidase
VVLSNGVFTIMQFRVAATDSADPSALPGTLRPVTTISESAAVNNRILTLGEKDDKASNPMTMLLNNAHWDMPVTENPKLNSVEIWNFLNFTDDSHPIHLHMVRFQILDRRSFEPTAYYSGGKIKYIGPAVPPAPNEAGWKDTVQAHPGMVRVALPHSGARRQRNDAALRHCDVVRGKAHFSAHEMAETSVALARCFNQTRRSCFHTSGRDGTGASAPRGRERFAPDRAPCESSRQWNPGARPALPLVR